MIRAPWKRNGTALLVGETVAAVAVTERIATLVVEAMNGRGLAGGSATNAPLPGDPKPTDVDAGRPWEVFDDRWPWEAVGTELHYDGTLYATCYTVGGARGLLTALRERESMQKELARLRAEAKPEQAGRKFWILLSPDGESRHVYDSAADPMIGGGWSIVRAVLDESPVKL